MFLVVELLRELERLRRKRAWHDHDAIGIGQWFRYLTGLLEVTGAALLLVPRAAGLGAGLLVPVMLGAILTHLVVLHSSPAMPAVLLVGVLFVAWGRRAQIVAFLQRFAA